MSDYRVNLDVFAGPLDLLMYLIRKDEVDIYDIQIADITAQYISYIEMMKDLDIDLAGDFLVMAATLMQIKSAMLLPKDDLEQLDSDDLSDPRTELIRQLLEYKKFKDASNLLADAVGEQNMRFTRPSTIVDRLKPDAEPEIDLDQVSVWDLLEAFDTIMKATGSYQDISHIKDDTPIDLYQIEILDGLQKNGPMTLERVFESINNRAIMIGMFLALLELVREGLVSAQQDASLKAIYLKPLTDEPAEQVVQKAIITAEDQLEEETTGQTVAHVAQQPAIAITELLPKSKSASAPDTQPQPNIPIAELPPKTLKTAPTDEFEKITQNEDSQKQTTD